ncbi:oxygenase MpaB family protein [Aspergillus mulundensis]|uniref:ER-bound oxygenase mpaB/mpaB'/Rubber oxygenase catalytic domain-containing protein n=1 Tax=Aspergillus mulundensis TaxID=1810919 RepID=A0A3D8T5E8_9EURO|nr:Uncharacterized protein DSM5745_01109 [Aspergillus mulundensis]RDW93787.1 Uncharacterized protein DSM5745_01109 [Aspergillus mulundensis]
MSLDEKANAEKISPVSSNSSSEQAQSTAYNANTNTPSLSALDNLQVLPKILQEGVLFVASGPALLLQAAHPGFSTTANTSTNLTTELTTSLHATLSYIACLVFGTAEEKEALLGRLRLGQPPLQSSPSSTPSSRPPASQLWLLATLYATATDFYQRIYGSFDYRTAEAAYDEFGVVLRHLSPTILPSDQALWPSTRAEFWKYWDAELPKLAVSAAAHDVATELARWDLPRGVGLTRPVLRAITIEMLPENIREGYGLKSTFGTRRLYATAMGLLKPVYPCIPRGWRASPVKYYLEELRRGISS